MRRGDFISVMFGAAAWPLRAYAQQGAPMRRLGALLLYSEDDAVGQQFIAAFVQGLADARWHDGDNIHIEYRWAGDDVARIRRAASELLALKPDVILATSTLTLESATADDYNCSSYLYSSC
jgi:putative tryptophan/tyrosine transport system substrate-binding protein